MVAIDVGLDLERVAHGKVRRAADQLAFVADLSAAFGIERRRVQYHHAALAAGQGGSRRAVYVERDDFCGFLKMLVASEDIAAAGELQRAVHLELAGGARLGFLPVHGNGKTGLVHAQATLTADVSGEVERKAIGVVQLEGDVAGQDLDAIGQRGVQDLHADFQRLEKALFLGLEHGSDVRLLLAQLGIGLAHEPGQLSDQFVEKRRFLAQQVAVANGAANDAALHVAPALVGRVHAISHQESSGADVVGNHAQALVAQVRLAGFAGGGLDQRVENVDFVVAVDVLQDGSQALQAHAGVHAGRGQRTRRAVLGHVELHEHVVPDLDEAVAVFARAARRAAGNVVAMVIEDLAAGAARPCIGHHPEVVGLVAAALVVADADDALGRQADLFRPDVVGLVVFLVDGGQQALGRQLVDLGQQLPRPFQRLALEIVAKAPVAQHLEKGMVARRVTDVFQIVVLAASAQTGLHRRCAHIGTLVGAEENVFELHHARVGEHQRRVVARHQ